SSTARILVHSIATPSSLYPLSLHDALPILVILEPQARLLPHRVLSLPVHQVLLANQAHRALLIPALQALWFPAHQAPAPETELRSEEHTSELQSRENLVCRLLLEKKKTKSK